MINTKFITFLIIVLFQGWLEIFLKIFRNIESQFFEKNLKTIKVYQTSINSLEIPEPDIRQKRRFGRKKGEAELYQTLFKDNKYNKWIRAARISHFVIYKNSMWHTVGYIQYIIYYMRDCMDGSVSFIMQYMLNYIKMNTHAMSYCDTLYTVSTLTDLIALWSGSMPWPTIYLTPNDPLCVTELDALEVTSTTQFLGQLFVNSQKDRFLGRTKP